MHARTHAHKHARTLKTSTHEHSDTHLRTTHACNARTLRQARTHIHACTHAHARAHAHAYRRAGTHTHTHQHTPSLARTRNSLTRGGGGGPAASAAAVAATATLCIRLRRSTGPCQSTMQSVRTRPPGPDGVRDSPQPFTHVRSSLQTSAGAEVHGGPTRFETRLQARPAKPIDPPAIGVAQGTPPSMRSRVRTLTNAV